MTFKIEIETNNDAFQDGNRDFEIRRIVTKALNYNCFDDRGEGNEQEFPLMDINGNKVGTISF